MTRRLIIVSNRLPVSVQEADDTLSLSRSSGGLATALDSLFKPGSALWIGWPGLRRAITDDELRRLDMPSHVVPVSLTPQQITHYYDHFSNGILWPLVHELPMTIPFSSRIWQGYVDVTAKFADAVEQVLQPTDTIWIHDYHLLLLPAELRRRGVENRIGFFLHTPFLTPTAIRGLPHANELLQSLLHVDVLGFQTKRDLRRFEEVCAALELQPSGPIVQAFPIGVDFDSFDRLHNDPTVKRLVSTFKKQLHGATLILSISRLDYTKGILTQLQAFRQLIEDLPTTTRVTYRLNIAPSRESVPEYQKLRLSVDQLVSEINAIFGTASWQPIIYTYENIGPNELAAWYQLADIHLNIPLADGMNLIAKEYVAARRAPGVLVISDAMGAADQLQQALIIPAENSTAASTALKHALAMPSDEKIKRWKALRHIVKTEHARAWAQNFLTHLSTTKE